MFGSKATVGLDIGTSSVKVVQLRRKGSAIELEKAASVAIYPDGERPSDAAGRRQAIVDAIKRALAQGGITAKSSISAVSGESIIVRYLQLPNMPEDELKKALQWEAEEYIPFRLDEVNLDSMVLGKSAEGDERVDVLLVSAKRDMIDEHLSMIREAGLTARIVDVDSFAFLNCYESNYDDARQNCIALVNIGAEITGISILEAGMSRFTREIAIGGNTITEAVRSHARVSYTEAEQLKMTQGANPPGLGNADTKHNFSSSLMDTIRGQVEQMTGDDAGSESRQQIVARAIGGVIADLISEVRRSIEFFENQTRGMSVEKIVLGGGTSLMPNLREHFEKDTGLTTEVIDPLRRIHPVGRDLDPNLIDRNRHMLSVGIGLGLRGIAA